MAVPPAQVAATKVTKSNGVRAVWIFMCIPAAVLSCHPGQRSVVILLRKVDDTAFYDIAAIMFFRITMSS